MKFWRTATSAAIVLLVPGCGSGGGGSSGSGGVTVPPVSASPTPTPSPTASPTYQTFSDPLANWEATANFAFVEYVRNGRLGAGKDTLIKMDADIRSGIVQANFSGRPSFSASFSDFMRGKFFALTDKDSVNNLGEAGSFISRFFDNGGYETIGIQYPSFEINPKETYKFKYSAYPLVKYEYLNSGTADQYATFYYAFIIGDKTKTNDLPKYDISRPGFAYTIFLNQVFAVPGDPNFPYAAGGSLNFSAAKGSFSGFIQYPDQTSTGANVTSRLDLTGTLDSQTNQISGTITSSNGLYTGKFQGSFYGPQGKEIGLFFSIRNKTGTFATAGTIRGASIVCTNFVNGVVINEVVCS